MKLLIGVVCGLVVGLGIGVWIGRATASNPEAHPQVAAAAENLTVQPGDTFEEVRRKLGNPEAVDLTSSGIVYEYKTPTGWKLTCSFRSDGRVSGTGRYRSKAD